jgi:hypothetical protein
VFSFQEFRVQELLGCEEIGIQNDFIECILMLNGLEKFTGETLAGLRSLVGRHRNDHPS